MPKVSVVIPTYNYARFLGEAIQSVLDQTFDDFELIIVDDGSTDNTKEVVASFADPRVKYIYQENRGVCAAQNTGIQASIGEYIALLGADDVLLENALEKGVEVLDSYPEVGFSYAQAYIMDENGHIYRVRKSSFLDASTIVDGRKEIRDLLVPYRITISAVMMRHHCLDEVGGFDEKIGNIAEDRHLIIRLAKRYSAAYIAEPLVKYRVQPGSLSRHANPRVAEEAFLLILQEVFEDPDFAPHFQSWKNEAYSYFYRRIASYAYGKDARLARHYMRKALRVYPQIMLQRNGIAIVYRYATLFLPDRLWLAFRHLKRHFQDPSKRLRD